MNITNFTELINSERSGVPATWVNMALPEQSACHNFKLSGVSTCGDIEDSELFIEIQSFNTVAPKETDKSFELSPGIEFRSLLIIDPVIAFTIYGDATLQSQLFKIKASQTIKFKNIGSDQEEEVRNLDIDVQEDDALIQFKITLTFKDAETTTSICCGSYYENAPFNECDGEGDTGDQNNDPACADYAVSISLTTAPDVLTATTLGGDPLGVETFKWYKDGIYFGAGASINPVLAGVYRVDAKKGNCTDSESFTYSTTCESFEVTVFTITQISGNGLFVAQANLVSTYQWQEFINDEWVDVDGQTSITYEPDHSGTFRVQATSGECVTESDGFDYDAPSTCNDVFTITLENVSGTLTVTIVDYEGEDTPSYQWYLDSGAGLTLLPSETESTLSNPVPGYYTVVVTLDECTQTASLLIQCDFEQLDHPCTEDIIWYQAFTGDGSTLAFAITLFYLLDPAHFNAAFINSHYLVQVNGITRQFVNTTPTNGITYTIDYDNQQIVFAAGFAPLTGELVEVRRIRAITI